MRAIDSSVPPHGATRLPSTRPMGDLAGMREQVYKDPRPAAAFTRFHERARTREPDWVYEVVRALTTLYGTIAFRARGVRSDRVPGNGPLILAPNHFSFMDHFFVGMFLRRQVQFMAKSQLFKRPMQWVYTHGGVFPVRRGHEDNEAFVTAEAILARGGCVVMYCEGGRSRTGELAERPRPGIGRLALQSGARVVPVAIHGSERVRNWKRLRFPQVTVHYGEPVTFERERDPSRDRQQRVAGEIFAEVKRLYAALDDGRLRKQAGRGAASSLLRHTGSE
jgi:1-acyl-sn-glycerol-3-phosphate acyltransferase